MYKKFLILCILLINSDSYAQNTTHICYISTNFLNKADIQLSHKFSVINIINNDIYEVRGLFNRDTTDKFIFKKSDKKWYFFQKNSWCLFFNPSKPSKKIFEISGYKYNIKWEKTKIMDGKEFLYYLRFIPIGFKVNHSQEYLFSYSAGIIAVYNGEFWLREDKKYIDISSLLNP